MRNEDDISDPDEEVPAPARSLGIHPPASALNSEGSQQRDTGTPSAPGTRLSGQPRHNDTPGEGIKHNQ